MTPLIAALVLAAGAGAQSFASCPILPVTTVEVQPLFYSEVIPYNTVIDPFRNGTRLTISVAPSTVVVSGFLTTTLLPGSTTSSTPTATATATTTSAATLSTSTGLSLTTTAPTSFTNASSTTTYSTVPISTATICIIATTSGQEQEQIAAAIDEWRRDVVFVNSFLDNPTISNATFNDIRTTAEEVYERAFDEPCQFGTLQNAAALGGLSNDTQYLCAKNNLASIFQTGVLDNLIAIIEDPSLITVRAHDINVARCCQVLPDVNILFRKANGIFPGAQPQPMAIDAPFPAACQSISCADDPNTTNCGS